MKTAAEDFPNSREMTRRTAVAGGAIAISSLIVGACRASPASASGLVKLAKFRKKSDNSDSAALERALATGSPVLLAAGGGVGPGGAYIIDGVRLRPGARIEGDGPETLVMPDPRGSGTCLIFDARDWPAGKSGIALRRLRISGFQRQRGFSEHVHLVNINGAIDVTIERVAFEAWQGDAVYFGSGYPDGGNLFNSGVIVQDCTFDGINRQCRNGISVTSGANILIRRCIFRNCTRADMPGPIDFELNKPGRDHLSNIVVTGCTFRNCGGTAGQVAFIAGRGKHNAWGRFEVSDNVFSDYEGTGSDVHVDLQNNSAAASTMQLVEIRGNAGSNGNRPMELKAAQNLRSEGNHWRGYRRAVVVGTPRGDTLGTLTLADRFEDIGFRQSPASTLDFYDVGSANLEGSQFGCLPGSVPIRLADGSTGTLALSSTAITQCGTRFIKRDHGYRIRQMKMDGRSIDPTRLLG